MESKFRLASTVSLQLRDRYRATDLACVRLVFLPSYGLGVVMLLL